MTTNYHDAVEAHIETITPILDTAFAQPEPEAYSIGQAVWMSDHYNTATILEAGEGKWLVETFDADGRRGEYWCDPEDLRPAVEIVDFRC